MSSPVRTIDPRTLAPRAAYQLLTSLVVPRPIAWVSTLSQAGTRNLAPHSYYNVISSEPPVVHFASAGEKDTLRNVRETGEFVINVVDLDHASVMNLTSADFPAGEDEFAWVGLTAAPSSTVAPPRVAGAPAALECRVHSELTIGNGTMVFGEVLAFVVAEHLLAEGIADPARLAALGRLGGSGYIATSQPIAMERPKWPQVTELLDDPPGPE